MAVLQKNRLYGNTIPSTNKYAHVLYAYCCGYIDGLLQDCSISLAYALDSSWSFTHIPQGCCIGSEAIVTFALCRWSDPKIYGSNGPYIQKPAESEPYALIVRFTVHMRPIIYNRFPSLWDKEFSSWQHFIYVVSFLWMLLLLSKLMCHQNVL